MFLATVACRRRHLIDARRDRLLYRVLSVACMYAMPEANAEYTRFLQNFQIAFR